jgi:hypothetical protein
MNLLEKHMDKYFKYGFFIAIFAVIALTSKMCSDQKKFKEADQQASNLSKALLDTLHHFQTKEGDWGAEKRTMQTELSTLKDDNLNLNANQKALIKEVERQNKTATTIAAALVELSAKVEGLTNDNAIVTDTTVNFPFNSVDLKYNLTVSNVKPIEFKRPILRINSLEFPNTQKINFHWKDDKEEGNPIAFSVTNTNQYFKITDIQSYAIPELKKKEIKPNFWNKVGKFSKTTGGKIVFLGAGFVLGVALIN